MAWFIPVPFWKTENGLGPKSRFSAFRLPFDFDFRISRPDGTLRHLNALARSETDAGGKVVKLFGTAIDITDRKAAEAALREAAAELEDRVNERTAELSQAVTQLEQEIGDRKQAEAALQGSEQNLRTIFNNVYDAIFIQDLEGNILDVNNRECSLLSLE